MGTAPRAASLCSTARNNSSKLEQGTSRMSGPSAWSAAAWLNEPASP